MYNSKFVVYKNLVFSITHLFRIVHIIKNFIFEIFYHFVQQLIHAQLTSTFSLYVVKSCQMDI